MSRQTDSQPQKRSKFIDQVDPASGCGTNQLAFEENVSRKPAVRRDVPFNQSLKPHPRMSPVSFHRRDTSLARLLAGTLAVLIALGVSLMGTASQCYGNAPSEHSGVVHAAQHYPHADASSDVSGSGASRVVKAVQSVQRTAPWGSRCEPVPTRSWGPNSATNRSVRPLDAVVQPHSISVQRHVSLTRTLPETLWEPSSSANPPQGYSSDSPPAQESMGTLLSVVLRL